MSDFKEVGNDTIHKDGWGIRFHGRETCEYFEGDRQVSFTFYYGGKKNPWSFVPEQAGKWDHPHDGETMSADKFKEIKERLALYLAHLGKFDPFVIEDY